VRPVELRRATEGDLAAQEEIFRAAIGEVYEQRNLVAPTHRRKRSERSTAISAPQQAQAGLRFTRPPVLLLLGPAVEPPRALAISGFSLF
jgi:hypothetical protein